MRSVAGFALTFSFFLLTASFSLLAKEKVVALTFDDGPNTSTPLILEILQRENVKATFFVVGKMAQKYPELLRRISLEGHELANHSFNHRDMRLLSPEERREELSKTRLAILEACGQDTYLFRPPGGRYNRSLVREMEKEGYKMILWTLASHDDGQKIPAREIARKVLTEARDRSIVLLHNGAPPTVKALPFILRGLRKRGFQFVTVSEMLEDR